MTTAALSVHEAVARILDGARPLSTEEIPIDAALGRVLATDIVSPLTLPRCDNSAMDGYAVRAEDVASATRESPVVLRVIETIAAGQPPRRRVQPLEAARIMTGAPVPEGADSVIRIEDTDGGTDTVAVFDHRDAKRNVRPRGEDVGEGETVLTSGVRLGPAQLGVLASIGRAIVPVVRRPSVAILSTGDEIVDVATIAANPHDHHIANSNGHTVAALVQEAGGIAVRLGIVRDDPDAIRGAVERGLEHDLLITTGGVSAGAFDYTRGVLQSLGATIAVHRVRMRPGAPTAFAPVRGTRWLGLPGNPVSTMVTFELLARPLLRVLGGLGDPFRRTIPVRLAEPVTVAAGLTHFSRVTLRYVSDGELPSAHLTGPQGSGLLTSMARADALLVLPAGREHYPAGERLRALPLHDGSSHSPTIDLPPGT